MTIKTKPYSFGLALNNIKG